MTDNDYDKSHASKDRRLRQSILRIAGRDLAEIQALGDTLLLESNAD
jgi:hypothetical protein